MKLTTELNMSHSEYLKMVTAMVESLRGVIDWVSGEHLACTPEFVELHKDEIGDGSKLRYAMVSSVKYEYPHVCQMDVFNKDYDIMWAFNAPLDMVVRMREAYIAEHGEPAADAIPTGVMDALIFLKDAGHDLTDKETTIEKAQDGGYYHPLVWFFLHPERYDEAVAIVLKSEVQP